MLATLPWAGAPSSINSEGIATDAAMGWHAIVKTQSHSRMGQRWLDGGT